MLLHHVHQIIESQKCSETMLSVSIMQLSEIVQGNILKCESLLREIRSSIEQVVCCLPEFGMSGVPSSKEPKNSEELTMASSLADVGDEHTPLIGSVQQLTERQ